MELPHKYFVLDKINRDLSYETDSEPRLDELETYQHQKGDKPNVRRLTQTKICYIDTRYAAKLRLYKYIMRKNGTPVKQYAPYEGTEIGKSLPILNF